jgi:uncharacterized protein
VDAPPRPARAIWLYLVVGLIGGFLSGFAGIGGGVILIPLMVGLLGVSQHQAHGTSLAIIVPTAVVAGTQYFVAPAGAPPPLDLALAYSLAAVPGAPLGARLITLLQPARLRQLFGLLLLSLAASSLTRETPYETAGNLFLVAGLVTLVAGTLLIAYRQHRARAGADGDDADGEYPDAVG